jgi:hypothetical protein
MRSNLFRTYTAAFVLLASAISFSACSKETLRGHGDTVTRTRTVGAYDEISLGGEFEVYLTQGPAADIILEGQENVLADLSTTTRNNKLEIEYKHSCVRIDKPVKVYLTTPNLIKFSISGANSVKGLTDWKVNDLEISSSGSSSVNLTLKEANSVESHISGSGEICLAGEANAQELDISGSGRLKAFSFFTKTTEIKISGSGRGDVSAENKLQANISGSGKVRYKGSPAVSASVSGSGSVEKAD